MKSLISKTFSRFAACCVVLFAVSAPLFYFVTKHFYAEDMIDIIQAVNEGHGIPPLDLERDIMVGMMIQFILIFVIVSVSLYITMRFVTSKLWHPFDDTLEKTERFNVSQSELLMLPDRETDKHGIDISEIDIDRPKCRSQRLIQMLLHLQ